MITSDNITVKIKAIVTDASDIAIAFLFGSAVNNRLRFDSDIDIAIAGYKVFSLNRMEEIACQLSKSINRPIDLIDLLSTKGLVFHRALTTGVPIIVKEKRILTQLMNECAYFGDDFLPAIIHMLEQKCRRFANA
jgi:predicted nucleotidyltransferase